VTRGRSKRCEGRVHPHLRRGVHYTHAVGTDDAHAVSPREPHKLPLRLRALGPGFGKARRNHHESVHPLLGTLSHDLAELVSRHGENCKVDVARDVEYARVSALPQDSRGRAMDWVEGSREPAVLEVAKDLVANVASFSPDTDYGDRARREQPRRRSRLRAMLAQLDGGPGTLGQLDRKGDMHHAGFHHALHPEARVAEEFQHAAVVQQRVGGKSANSMRAGDHRQVFQQQCAEAPTLVRVGDHECDLRLIAARGAVVAGQGYKLVPEHRNEAHVRIVIGMGKMGEQGRLELRHG